MLSVYQLLAENRTALSNQLVQQARLESRYYHRISRIELKECMEAMVDAYTDFLVSKNKHKLKIILGYWVKVRLSQSFQFSAILKSTLCFGPVLRLFLQDAYRRMPHEESATFNKAMQLLERGIFEMTDCLIEVFEEQRTTPQLKKNLDLSKLSIFRG